MKEAVQCRYKVMKKAFRKTVRLVFAERTVMIFGRKCDILPKPCRRDEMFCLFFCLEFYFGKLQRRKFPFKDIKFNGQFIGKWNQVSDFWMRIPSIFSFKWANASAFNGRLYSSRHISPAPL